MTPPGRRHSNAYSPFELEGDDHAAINKHAQWDKLPDSPEQGRGHWTEASPAA